MQRLFLSPLFAEEELRRRIVVVLPNVVALMGRVTNVGLSGTLSFSLPFQTVYPSPFLFLCASRPSNDTSTTLVNFPNPLPVCSVPLSVQHPINTKHLPTTIDFLF